jgi:hypothetical protein
MLRKIVSLSLLAAVIVGGLYLYSHDPDDAKCDQACVAESSQEP